MVSTYLSNSDKLTELVVVTLRIVATDINASYNQLNNDLGVPLMTEAESELSAIEAVIRMNTRREEDFQLKIGKPKYSLTAYNKIKRATLLLDNEDYPILMMSLNKEADHEHIILDKVLPIIRKEGLSSSS